MKFLLKDRCGNHAEGRGKDMRTYVAGDIVESELDLAAHFPDKFERLADDDVENDSPTENE